MGLEKIDGNSTPDDLNASWPLGTDTMDKGDDHIRGIKQVIKNFYNMYKNLKGVKGPYSGKYVRRWSGNAKKVTNSWGASKVYLVVTTAGSFNFSDTIYVHTSGICQTTFKGHYLEGSVSCSADAFTASNYNIIEIWELTTGS